MNIINQLTLRHLRLNRSRTLITLAGIMLSVAMVCAVAGFVFSVRDMMIRTVKETRGDYHIVFVDVTADTAAKIADEDVFSTHYSKEGDTAGLSNIYLRLENPGRGYLQVTEAIAQKYGATSYGANKELLALEGAIAQDNVVRAFVIIAAVVITIVVAGSIIVIANAFYISAQERVRQFGLLKSAGATSGQIGRSILFEALVLAVIAIPIGIALGFAIQAVVLWLTNGLLTEISRLNNDTMNFHVFFSPLIVAISVGISALTLLISAWLPARRAANTSPIEAIRQSKDIRIQPKQFKTSRLAQWLFGFEGTLAAKSPKRSKGKYRATVISLTVSIVLFMCVSSFVWVLNKGAEMEYGGMDFDVMVFLNGGLAQADEAQQLLDSIADSETKKITRIPLTATVPDGFVSENARESMTEQNQYGLMLYPLPDAEFAQIAPAEQGELAGILINTTGAFTEGGKVKEATPYNCPPGTKLLFEQGSVTVAKILPEIPASIPAALFDGGKINILIPEAAYRGLDWTQAIDMDTIFVTNAQNPAAFESAAEELLLPAVGSMDIWNVSQMTRMNRNLTLIIMLFGYGFIAMLSLIAVTSVIATISTGMALRRQEFAMLYSAGMTSQGMSKMLDLESLLYGLKSLVIGLPLGLTLSYLIYMGMANVAEFAYKLPWSAMIISTVTVMLLTFGTMRYSKGKLNKLSIVEAIRNETA